MASPHIATGVVVVIIGFGCTVCVTGNTSLEQPPVVAVAVTLYTTLPSVAVELASVCAILVPQADAHAVAPVTPVTVPSVHVKVLVAALVVSGIAVIASPHIATGVVVVITGLGCTVCVMAAVPVQPPPAVEVAVILYTTLPSVAVALASA